MWGTDTLVRWPKMKAFRSFTVRARLPEPLAPLQELAFNLRWSWDDRTRDVFRWVDPYLWDRTQHDPVQVLSLVARERLEALAKDNAFMSFLGEIHADLRRYMSVHRWFQDRGRSALTKVAYFSPEFGIAEALPQYSGGLGILAGDHLKAASSLGVPMVGVGLLYREGYFRQRLNADGWQEERYPVMDPNAMALTPVDGTRVTVDLAGQALIAQLWVAYVGRVKLYLLDANIDENPDDLRAVTDRLYGGATEHRLRQEILLGIGGVRALEALHERAQIFHSNEGHAGFLSLERIRQLVTVNGLSFAEAIEANRAGTVFTTHTPVAAGIDRFPAELMEKYFSGWAHECGVGIEELMALGHAPGEPNNAPFNMAVMGLRLASMSNGVSKLHGHTSRLMFQQLFPSVPVDEVPIGSVTNGVHGRTWVSPAMSDLFTKYVNPSWEEAGLADWARISEARDDELWRAREQGKEALIGFVRAHLRASLLEKGVSPIDAAWADEALDPTVLTIGFARRFASYKRATLLLSQPERLKALLLDSKRPVQLVFAGKAHPADDLGKEMIRQLLQFTGEPAVRHRTAFIEDYDIAVARMMLQGCDVWLNNPRRPTGGQRHQRAESGPQRGAQLFGARRLVGRDVRRQERMANRVGRVLWRRPAPGRGRSQQRLRDPRTPGHPALLRPRWRPLPAPVGRSHQGLLEHARAPGPGVAHGPRIRDPDVRADGQEGGHVERPGLRKGQRPGRMEAARARGLGGRGRRVRRHRRQHAGDRSRRHHERHGRGGARGANPRRGLR